jgi:hypothetical protein
MTGADDNGIIGLHYLSPTARALASDWGVVSHAAPNPEVQRAKPICRLEFGTTQAMAAPRAP